MSVRVINLAEKFAVFSDHFSPKITGELNDSYIKLAKLQGDFMWHHHDDEDELFLVVKGRLQMKIREEGVERQLEIGPGELIVIPKGMEHFPSSEVETHVLLIEPKTTLNTGNIQNERTREKLDTI